MDIFWMVDLVLGGRGLGVLEIEVLLVCSC